MTIILGHKDAQSSSRATRVRVMKCDQAVRAVYVGVLFTHLAIGVSHRTPLLWNPTLCLHR